MKCKMKSKKILYDKYVLMLSIRDDHIKHHFSEKFVSLCQVEYFINAIYISRMFYIFGDDYFYEKIIIFVLLMVSESDCVAW